MAKVKFSALISGMSGKLNGSVFATNRGGAYLRTKVTPINPNTAAQSAARNLLTSFSQGWKNLTQTQRDAWNAAVDSWTRTDIFGDIRVPTGLQLYIRLNVNISIAGGVAITVPPLSVGVDALVSAAIAVDGTLQTFVPTITPDPVPADHALVIESTVGQSAGVNNANSKFRTILVVPAGAVPADIIAEYTTKFGAVVIGQKYFMRIKQIRLSTGEVSGTLIAKSIATA